jgi:A/G-specific adenine glycosylase
MSNGPRKRAPTRPIYIESSDEENGDISFGEPQVAPGEDASIALASSPTLSSPASQSPSLKRKSSEPARALSINDALMSRVSKPAVEKVHPSSRHSVAPVLACQPQLLAWYDKAKTLRGMPWRKDHDPDLTPDAQSQRAYEVLTSEIMLQQTQMLVLEPRLYIVILMSHSATVIPYYNKWMETFPTVHALAAADIEAVNQRWKGLGYYSRAARLLAAAKKVVNELGGQFPSDAASMEKLLPGVGRYTAGAVCSIVFNERAPAVDGNVQRLFSRLLALHAPLKGTNAKEPLELIWKAAHKLVKGCSDAGALNQAFIELGSTICKPSNPACGNCPLQKGCAAHQLSQVCHSY